MLWAVLAINAVTFAVEVGAGLAAGSAALQADALDFLGDAAKASTMAGTEPPPAECPLFGANRSRRTGWNDEQAYTKEHWFRPSQYQDRMVCNMGASLYEPLNVYKLVAPNIGIVDGAFEYLTVGGAKLPLPFTTRMTVVRLSNGDRRLPCSGIPSRREQSSW